jgi:hypothetical protein
MDKFHQIYCKMGMKKMLNEGNQIHNFILCVTVLVPVPHGKKLRLLGFRFRFRFHKPAFLFINATMVYIVFLWVGIMCFSCGYRDQGQNKCMSSCGLETYVFLMFDLS